MMKKKTILLSILAIAALAVAIYCISYFTMLQSAKVPAITYSGLSDVFKKMERAKPGLKQKSYYYFNAWNTRCKPCIEEMPRLDSIADKLSPKIGFIYVTDDSEEKASAFLRKKGIQSRNFTYLHDMNEFISAVYHSQGIKHKIFPTHFVTDSIGTILFFKEGSLSYGKFEEGHQLSEADKKFLEKLQDPLVAFLKTIR